MSAWATRFDLRQRDKRRSARPGAELFDSRSVPKCNQRPCNAASPEIPAIFAQVKFIINNHMLGSFQPNPRATTVPFIGA